MPRKKTKLHLLPLPRQPLLRAEDNKTERLIVAVAVSMSHFLQRENYRAFAMRMRRELRKRDFAAAGVFFEMHEESALVIERLRQCHPDKLLWYCPGKLAREIAPHLADSGIPIVGVGDGGSGGIPCRYEIERQQATSDVLRVWKNEGLEEVTLVLGPRRSPGEEDAILRLADDIDLEVDIRRVESNSLAQPFDSLSSRARRA